MNKTFGFFRNNEFGEITNFWDPNINVANVSLIDIPSANVAYGVNFAITSNLNSSPKIYFDVEGASNHEMFTESLTGNTVMAFNGNANVTVYVKPSSNITSNTNIVINLRAGSPDAEPFYTQNAVIENYTNIVATGGTVTTLANGDKLHAFTANSTYNLTAGNAFIKYLIVAGGGGGGGRPYAGGGFVNGGGAGGGGLFESNAANFFQYQTTVIPNTFSPNAYPVIVGAGGLREENASTGINYSPPTSGGNSSIFGITTQGGGYGGPAGLGAFSTLRPGGNGGSGGGGGRTANGTFNLIPGTDGIEQKINLSGLLIQQGFNGGLTRSSGFNNSFGGGGGGAGTTGASGTTSGARGGDGKTSSITDVTTYYSGGGGGSSNFIAAGPPGLGGGSEFYGGGGSAWLPQASFSNGGSGVVYVRYGPYGKKLVLT
jgi:hypothetical protein